MDVVLQLGTHDDAHRLKLYATSGRLQELPGGRALGCDAAEVGPPPPAGRRCGLVLFRGCKASRQDLLRLVRSTFLSRYIVRIYWCDHEAPSRAALLRHLPMLLASGLPDAIVSQATTGQEGQEGGAISGQTAPKDSVGDMRAVTSQEANGRAVALAMDHVALEDDGRWRVTGSPTADGPKEDTQVSVRWQHLGSTWQGPEKPGALGLPAGSATAQQKLGALAGMAVSSPSPVAGCLGAGRGDRSRHSWRSIARLSHEALAARQANKKSRELQLSQSLKASRDQDAHSTISGSAEEISKLSTLAEPRNEENGEHVSESLAPALPGQHRGVLRLQTFPRELAEALIDDVNGFAECCPKTFSHTLNIVVLQDESGAGERWKYSITPAGDMYLTPSWQEGRAANCASRAVLKLEEVFAVTAVIPHRTMRAIDVGAAPGAWTQYLSTRIGRVAAVDPGQLCVEALQPNVHHIAKKVEDAINDLAVWRGECKIDMLVCDVNKHPAEAARMLAPLLPSLASGGLLVMSLKFHGKGKTKWLQVEEILQVFGDAIVHGDCLWLLANSIYERTFIAIKR
eukprot:SM000040S14785  [mRNA]  locus=s40:309563:312726:+ [translate_table: standard]